MRNEIPHAILLPGLPNISRNNFRTCFVFIEDKEMSKGICSIALMHTSSRLESSVTTSLCSKTSLQNAYHGIETIKRNQGVDSHCENNWSISGFLCQSNRTTSDLFPHQPTSVNNFQFVIPFPTAESFKKINVHLCMDFMAHRVPSKTRFGCPSDKT